MTMKEGRAGSDNESPEPDVRTPNAKKRAEPSHRANRTECLRTAQVSRPIAETPRSPSTLRHQHLARFSILN
jgi:hypothetical protein